MPRLEQARIAPSRNAGRMTSTFRITKFPRPTFHPQLRLRLGLFAHSSRTVKDIGSQSWLEPEAKPERVVVWEGYKSKRRDGVLWCSMEELDHWGDAIEQQREAWIGTPVELLFR